MSWLDRFRRGGGEGEAEKPASKRELGRSGTVNSQGFIQDEDENWELRWPNNMLVYDRMRRSDPTVKWMLMLMKVPIGAATFYCEPASDDPEDLEAAAFVEHALFEELEDGWSEFLRKALTMLDFGHSVFETVAELRQVEFEYTPPRDTEDDDEEEPEPEPPSDLDPPLPLDPFTPKPEPKIEEPEPVTVEREAFVLSKLAERRQKTIQMWNPVDGKPSELKSIEQWLGDALDPPNVTIPAEYLVIFTNEKEGDDHRGVALLRSAWRDWKYKVELENLEAIAYERSTGVPVAYPPMNADDDDVDSVEDALEGLRQGENLWIIMPGPKAGNGVDPQEGWELDDWGLKGDADADPDKAIQRHETGMARNVLAEFMRLGHENTGARATADVQQDPYYLAVTSVVNYMLTVINREIVARLVAWNYDVKKPPKLKVSKIQAKNLQVIAQALGVLAEKGLIAPDVELEKHLREIFELPEKVDEPEEPEPTTAELQGKLQERFKAAGVDPVLPETEPQPMPVPRVVPVKTRSDFEPPRQLRPEEEHVALSEIMTLLDNGEADLVELVQKAGHEEVRRVETAIATAVAAQSPEAVAQLGVESYEIEKAVLEVLEGLYEKGTEHVRAELRAQRGTIKLSEGLISKAASKGRLLRSVAKAAAETIAAAATRAIRQRALRMLQDGSAPTGAGFDPMAAMRAEAHGAGRGIVAAAFNLGRNDEAISNAGEISHSVYTAILDKQTCTPCGTADGTTGPPGGLPELPCPNPNCLGGGACRCMWVNVVSGG